MRPSQEKNTLDFVRYFHCFGLEGLEVMSELNNTYTVDSKALMATQKYALDKGVRSASGVNPGRWVLHAIGREHLNSRSSLGPSRTLVTP